jgi:hypothetical protein
LPVILLVFSSFLKIAVNFYKNNIRTRRINQVLIFYFVFQTLVLILLQSKTLYIDVCLLFVPSAVFIAYLLVGQKYRRYKEAGNIALLAIAITGIYLPVVKAYF